MDANHFDAWTLALTAAGSRRALVGALLGGALGGLGGGLGGGREAAAGDRESGQRCKRDAQCITEICAGHAASHSFVFEQAPKPSRSIRATIRSTRSVRSARW